jgi:ATP phosphoribosyltransferase
MPKLALDSPTVLAVPKGRIFEELSPILARVGITPEPAFFKDSERALSFKTNHPMLTLIRVRSFDVATFVAHGAAQLGVAGSDVIYEFDYPDLYAPLDLGIGKCRLSVAEPARLAESDNPARWSHVRIATKYPHLTQTHFAARGIVAECVKLQGAMELAPSLGLAERIVDLVSSGATLKANGLVEVETLMQVSSRLIVGRTAYKTRSTEMASVIAAFAAAISGQ